jgi:hypothetical protein
MIIVSNTLVPPNTAGFVESHIIRATDVDAAGNRTDSAPLTIFIQHEVKPKK